MASLPEPSLRIGHGFDVHRIEPAPNAAGNDKPLILAGVTLSRQHRVIAHSDGDVLLHALTDALLGALGLHDIGELFPDSDPRWKNAASVTFFEEATRLVAAAGYSLSNADATIILERPRLSNRKGEIRAALAALTGLPPGRVNVKGKSHEGLDALGQGQAIACHCVALLTATRQPAGAGASG